MAQIHEQLIKVMTDIGVVGKSGQNTNQKYSFRKAEDVVNECHKPFGVHGVLCLPNYISHERSERQSSTGGVLVSTFLVMRFDFTASDGSTVSCTTVGEGMDSGDKSANKAMTAAFKYALTQAFMIATEALEDSENANPSLAPGAFKKPEPTLEAAGPVKKFNVSYAQNAPTAASSRPVTTALKVAPTVVTQSSGQSDTEAGFYEVDGPCSGAERQAIFMAAKLQKFDRDDAENLVKASKQRNTAMRNVIGLLSEDSKGNKSLDGFAEKVLRAGADNSVPIAPYKALEYFIKEFKIGEVITFSEASLDAGYQDMMMNYVSAPF